MKVQTISLDFFKRFRNKSLNFCNPVTGLAKNLIVLVGPNGSGKSTVLQAIAATVGVPTRRLQVPSELDWPGFSLSLANNAWQLPMEVKVDVEFSDTEIEATREFFRQVPEFQNNPDAIEPSDKRIVSLYLKDERIEAGTHREYYQFCGREYARQILKLRSEGHEIFKQVGSIFWYHEHRLTTSFTAVEENGRTIKFDLDLLRRRLSDLMQFHDRVRRGEYKLRPGQRDLFADIEKAYQAVFPNHRFDGPVPRVDIDEVLSEPWFYLFDGKRQYELSEMSGGERAIFPLIFDFAALNIHRSIILIDELELHLHPPMQQALLRALQQLGNENQFIITTHSDAVADILPEEAIFRLEED